MQFTGTVKNFDADEGVGWIIRDRDRHEIPVRSSGLAIGVSLLEEGDAVEFDVDMGLNPHARNVMRR